MPQNTNASCCGSDRSAAAKEVLPIPALFDENSAITLETTELLDKLLARLASILSSDFPVPEPGDNNKKPNDAQSPMEELLLAQQIDLKVNRSRVCSVLGRLQL